MTAAMPADPAECYVEVASARQVRKAVRRSLKDLGVSYEELKRQAHEGRFQSNRARLVWMAIRDVGQEG
jgi:hypothetical protein